MFKLEKAIAQTMSLQDKANRVMAGEDWRTKDIDWVSCALAKLGAAMDWTGYRHWEKTDPNFFQTFIEVIESYHFMLSLAIEKSVKATDLVVTAQTFNGIYDGIAQNFKNSASTDERKALARRGLKNLAIHCLHSVDSYPNLLMVAQSHLSAAAHLGFKSEEFFRIYISKNTVKLFRQANDDREGNYPRIWSFEGEMMEDNQVVEILTKRDPALAYDAERLTEVLQEILSTQPAMGTALP